MRRVVRSPAALFAVAVLLGLAVGALLPPPEAKAVNNHACAWIQCSYVQCSNPGCGEIPCTTNSTSRFYKCYPWNQENCVSNPFTSSVCVGTCGEFECSCVYQGCFQ